MKRKSIIAISVVMIIVNIMTIIATGYIKDKNFNALDTISLSNDLSAYKNDLSFQTVTLENAECITLEELETLLNDLQIELDNYTQILNTISGINPNTIYINDLNKKIDKITQQIEEYNNLKQEAIDNYVLMVTDIPPGLIPKELADPEPTTTTTTTTTTTITSTKPITTTNSTTKKPITTTTSKPNSKYAIAEEIWGYLKSYGWSDEVCAGIMGNIMVESGGLTLDITYHNKTAVNKYGRFYGICMWNLAYTPKGFEGASVKEQCEYLRDTLYNQFKTFGYYYYQGFNADTFLQMKNINDIALAFAKCYEICGAGGGYAKRQNCAQIAYNYFVK
jgi:hypothetical protein